MNKKYLPINKVSFVLIELLVALSIFALICGAIYTTLYAGIKSYRIAQKEMKFNQELNLILDRLSMELRNSYDAEYDDKEDRYGFIADSNSLSFFTIQNIYIKGELNRTLARITYSFKDGKLFKKTQLDKNAFLNRDEFKEEELISGIEELNFKYLYVDKKLNGYKWDILWPDKSIIPKGVSVEIKLEGLNNNSADFKRYIFIMQGEITRK